MSVPKFTSIDLDGLPCVECGAPADETLDPAFKPRCKPCMKKFVNQAVKASIKDAFGEFQLPASPELLNIRIKLP